MQRIKSLYAKAAGLSLALMLTYSLASAQCSPQIGNYATCTGPKFVSIYASSCEAGINGGSEFTITITVDQSGGTYNAYAGGGGTIVSSSNFGTTLTYVVRKAFGASSVGLAVHRASPCSNNFASIQIE